MYSLGFEVDDCPIETKELSNFDVVLWLWVGCPAYSVLVRYSVVVVTLVCVIVRVLLVITE